MNPTSRLTARARLTLLLGGLVVVAGATLLGMVLLLLDRVVETQPIVLDSPFAGLLVERAVREDLRARTLHPLVAPSLVALGVLTASSLVTGWFVAGRVLRPVRTITASAQQVAAGRLDKRVGLKGPRDELRELADAFDAMLDRLDHSFASQRAFVGNASHELRTPVAIARTLVEVALAAPDVPAETLRLGTNLLEINARQDRLIEGLLTLARSGHALEDVRPIDLVVLVRDVVDRCRSEAEQRNVAVFADLPAAGSRVLGDAVLVERLIENLALNGLRHNVAHDGWMRVELRQDADRTSLRVVNTGPLVPEDDVARLFEPFRRARDRVAAVPGAGLGLSIVKAVAEAHSATVNARAQRDGGLSVEVRFLARAGLGRAGPALRDSDSMVGVRS